MQFLNHTIIALARFHLKLYSLLNNPSNVRLQGTKRLQRCRMILMIRKASKTNHSLILTQRMGAKILNTFFMHFTLWLPQRWQASYSHVSLIIYTNLWRSFQYKQDIFFYFFVVTNCKYNMSVYIGVKGAKLKYNPFGNVCLSNYCVGETDGI